MKKSLILATIMLLVSALFASAQTQIKGKVLDSDGTPVAGASVMVPGTQTGTSTGFDGTFSLTVGANDKVIEVSFLGMETHRIPVTGNMTNLRVVLADEANKMDEVVFVAYGTTKKSSFTGSASVVKSENLEKINAAGFTEALQGMAAGVQVSNFQGNPGAEARIQIRGISSMSGSSNPLYIVDGMPYDGTLTSINPSDIESLTVLKDAAASSLYGSRAANGVVIITTKKGAQGRTKVNVRAGWGTSDNAVPFPKTVADPMQTLLYNWEAMYNDNIYYNNMSKQAAGDDASSKVVTIALKAVNNSAGQSSFVSPFQGGIDPTQWVLHDGNGNPYINPDLKYAWEESDWDVYKAVTSRKLRQDYGVDFSGSTDSGKTSYFASIGYLNDNGFLLSQYYKRYSFRANVQSQVTKWLQLGGSLSYAYYRQNSPGSNRALIYSSTLTSP